MLLCDVLTVPVTQPTPMEYLMYLAVTILSLLAGASVVHNIYKPDMVIQHGTAHFTYTLLSAAVINSRCLSVSIILCSRHCLLSKWCSLLKPPLMRAVYNHQQLKHFISRLVLCIQTLLQKWLARADDDLMISI